MFFFGYYSLAICKTNVLSQLLLEAFSVDIKGFKHMKILNIDDFVESSSSTDKTLCIENLSLAKQYLIIFYSIITNSNFTIDS